MANRPPAVAMRNFNGFGVMVIGASKESTAGVPKGTEEHELENRISPYTGREINWFLRRIPTDESNEVIFLIVEPPKAGDKIFPCRKDFSGSNGGSTLQDGAIYIRSGSETRLAKSTEIDELSNRTKTSAPSSVALKVVPFGEAIQVADTDQFFETSAQAAVEKIRVTAESQISERLTSHDSQSRLAQLLGRDDRDLIHENTEARIVRKEARWRQDWPQKLLTCYALSPHRVGVTLTSPVFLRSPQLIICFKNALGVSSLSQNDVDLHEVHPTLEPTPHPFGLDTPNVNRYLTHLNNGIVLENSADGISSVVTITPPELRPDTPWSMDSDYLSLIARDPSGTAVQASWSFTSEEISDRITGTFTIPVHRYEKPENFFLPIIKRVNEGRG